jgi:O-antigen ligase
LHNAGESTWWDARIPIWETSWNTFLGNPILGAGRHTFRYVSADNIQVNWAHNVYLETLAEQGLVGLAALTGLLVTMVCMAARIRKRASGDQRIVAAALMATTIGILFAGIFEISFVRQWVNELVFFTAGATALLHRLTAETNACPE